MGGNDCQVVHPHCALSSCTSLRGVVYEGLVCELTALSRMATIQAGCIFTHTQ